MNDHEEQAAYRARFIIRSYCELPRECFIHGTRIKSSFIDEFPHGEARWLVDVYPDEAEIESSYYQAIDLIEEFLDRIAFLGFSGVACEIIGIGPEFVILGEVAEIAVPLAYWRRSRTSLSADHIAALDKAASDPTADVALRLFRNGISDSNPYHRHTQLWQCLELIGRKDAEKHTDYNEHACPQCGAAVTSTPKTQERIRTFYIVSPSQEHCHDDEGERKRKADNARKLRGTLSHGGKLHNRSLRQETEQQLSATQAAALAAISTQLGIKSQIDHCEVLGMPLVIFQLRFQAEDGQKPVLEQQIFTRGVAFSIVADTFSEKNRYVFETGMSLSPQLPVELVPKTKPQQS